MPSCHRGVPPRGAPSRLAVSAAGRGGPAAAAVAKAYCAPSRNVCETRIQVTAASANTGSAWPTSTLRRALAVQRAGSRGVGAASRRVLADHGLEVIVDFGDSPDGGRFPGTAPHLAPDNDPDYRHRPRRMILGGPGRVAPGPLRRRLLRPVPGRPRFGGPRLPTVYETIGGRRRWRGRHTPPRPSWAICQGILEHRKRGRAAAVPGWLGQRPGNVGPSFSEPDAGSDLASLRTRADATATTNVITGHKVGTSYSDIVADCGLCWPEPTPTCPSTRGSRPSSSRAPPGIAQLAVTE